MTTHNGGHERYLELKEYFFFLIFNKTRKKTVQNLLLTDPDYYKKIVQKSKKTKLERYGDENFANVEKNKKTKLERFGDENYRDMKKQKQTKRFRVHECETKQ